jgi:glyoxylase-like metal-dependent hydrolase (beta-lactamase superfamily II)
MKAYLNYLVGIIVSYFLAIYTGTLAIAGTALPEPEVVKLNQRVYALLGPAEIPTPSNHGYMVNSAIVIGHKGVILIDTGFSHEIGQHLKQTIAKITSKPVTHIINTHDHGDHVLGNSAFSKVTIISSAKCKSAMEKTAYEWRDRLAGMTGIKPSPIDPVMPEVTYTEDTRTNITLQGIPLQIWVPYGSHTNNDLMVYLPEDKILVAGDILVNTMMPSFADGNIKNWINTLQQINQLEVTSIIPGHGKLMTRQEVMHMHDAMSALYAGVKVGYEQGLMDSEVRKTLDLSYWRRLKYFDNFMGINLNRTYLEVERDSF